MDEYRYFRRTQDAQMVDWHPGFDMTGVSISGADFNAGSPTIGDMIARNPHKHEDKWLVAKAYARANFEEV